jgi:hypothetical protein
MAGMTVAKTKKTMARLNSLNDLLLTKDFNEKTPYLNKVSKLTRLKQFKLPPTPAL